MGGEGEVWDAWLELMGKKGELAEECGNDDRGRFDIRAEAVV
jgi:hypothetical protein